MMNDSAIVRGLALNEMIVVISCKLPILTRIYFVFWGIYNRNLIRYHDMHDQ